MITTPSPATPAPRGDRRRQRTRSAILGAGQKLFATRAMEGVSIDDIVAEADVAKGSFYNHFDDKEGLANAILELVHGDCEFHILTANRAIEDPALRIARALCVMRIYAAEHPDRLRALLSLSERRRITGSPLNAGVIGDIEDGLAKGRFTGISVEAGLLIATTLIGAVVMHIGAGDATGPADDHAAMIAAALLRALGVPAAEATPLAHDAVTSLLTPRSDL